ncbi:hypothetical protein ACRAWF_16085 [Streptomyces sp. L7]
MRGSRASVVLGLVTAPTSSEGDAELDASSPARPLGAATSSDGTPVDRGRPKTRCSPSRRRGHRRHHQLSPARLSSVAAPSSPLSVSRRPATGPRLTNWASPARSSLRQLDRVGFDGRGPRDAAGRSA